jgi:hypothetical protein
LDSKSNRERAKRYGDFIAQIDAEYLISDLERMTDGEYEAYTPAMDRFPSINDFGEDTSIPNLLEMEYTGE